MNTVRRMAESGGDQVGYHGEIDRHRGQRPAEALESHGIPRIPPDPTLHCPTLHCNTSKPKLCLTSRSVKTDHAHTSTYHDTPSTQNSRLCIEPMLPTKSQPHPSATVSSHTGNAAIDRASIAVKGMAYLIVTIPHHPITASTRHGCVRLVEGKGSTQATCPDRPRGVLHRGRPACAHLPSAARRLSRGIV